jgi:peptide/nickel transport system substrate-binding protein
VWVNNFTAVKGLAAYRDGKAQEIEGITAVNDQTVRFELSQPNASFLYNTYLGILPSHILSKSKPEELEKNPYVDAPTVTSGPYDFVKYEPGQYIQLKKKANYWGTPSQVDEIYIKPFDATATMLAQLEAGELHLATVPAEEAVRLRTLKHLDVLSVPGIGYYVTHFDFRTADIIALHNKSKEQGGKGFTITDAPKVYMQDKRFRQALMYAVDRAAVIKVVAGGEGTPIYSSIFGPDWAINPSLNKYERNLDKAKQLMKDVGVTFAENGTALWDKQPITLVYLSNTSEEARKLGEVLQQQFGQVGVRLDIKLVTSAAFLQAAYNGEGDLIRNAGGRFGADPSVTSLYYTCKAGWAESVIGYCNPKFDELMAKGVATSKQEERQKIYWEASAILNDELPSLFFYTASSFVGINKGLTGIKPSSDPGYMTWNIREWTFSK